MGTNASFEALYRRYAGTVMAYALRRTTRAAADDVVADVFVVAWRRLDDLPEDPLPWLLGVARRVLANRRRGEGRADALRSRLAFESPHAVEGVDVDDRVIRALERLGEHDRELVMLVAWEGLGQADVARVLGVRTGTVAVRMHRARQRFARALAAEDADDLIPMEVPR